MDRGGQHSVRERRRARESMVRGLFVLSGPCACPSLSGSVWLRVVRPRRLYVLAFSFSVGASLSFSRYVSLPVCLALAPRLSPVCICLLVSAYLVSVCPRLGLLV